MDNITQKKDLEGLHIVVSAGGTRERIDAVRYLTNDSSGKMGYALAEVAFARGARVSLVCSVERACADGVEQHFVNSAAEMQQVLLEICTTADVLVMAAAVADFRVANPMPGKIKREAGESLTLELEATPDVLSSIDYPQLFKVAFAAETEELLKNAQAKLKRKGASLMVANDITKDGAGFGTDTNIVTLLDANGGRKELPCMSKLAVAEEIYDEVQRLRVSPLG